MSGVPWLTVVGLGEDGLVGLSASARSLVERADVLIGGERHFALIGTAGAAERITWNSPLSKTLAEIERQRGRRAVVLATGDPMWYGVGATLSRHFGREAVAVIPHVSAFALAAARFGWPLADVETISLHGRPFDLLALHLYPGARVLALSEDGGTPAAAAAYLAARGWQSTAMTVLEHIGGPHERRIDGIAASWAHPRGADLNVLALELQPGPEAKIFPRVAGLPDDAFVHDGQLTKREVRAMTLAALTPLPGQLLWDVGAGCGSIGIEWMRAARGATAIAVEMNVARVDLIARNAAALGVPGIDLRVGRAPEALAGLPAPDAVFIGGGLGAPGLFELCWTALKPGGRLVANAVTIEGEARLVTAARDYRGTLTRIAVSHAEAVGDVHVWRPKRPITQLAAAKP
jgi:precorrin-6B C5,15-methyltransferase / cobalt-precorrin-6B C5,C15-methyltransferase